MYLAAEKKKVYRVELIQLLTHLVMLGMIVSDVSNEAKDDSAGSRMPELLECDREDAAEEGREMACSKGGSRHGRGSNKGTVFLTASSRACRDGRWWIMPEGESSSGVATIAVLYVQGTNRWEGERSQRV